MTSGRLVVRDRAYSGPMASETRDEAVDPTGGLLTFLDRYERLPDAVARRRRSYELLDLRPGARVVDVGCGAGTAVREAAAFVAPGGSAVGVDIQPALVEVASARAARAAVATAAFHVGSAEALPLPDASVDAYRAERLYQHLPSPTRALAEARRVLAPGGRIVLVDQDWDGLLVDSDDLATTRAIVRAFGDGIVNGRIGRAYHRVLTDAGLSDVRVHVEAAASTCWGDYGFFVELLGSVGNAVGAAKSEVVEAWVAEQRERGARGRFFLVMTHFLATART